MRLIMALGAMIVTSIGVEHTVWPCDKLASVAQNQTDLLIRYPGCEPLATGTNPGQNVVVDAMMQGHGENFTAPLSLHFGAALWLALTLHAVGIEVYVSPVSATPCLLLLECSSII